MYASLLDRLLGLPATDPVEAAAAVPGCDLSLGRNPLCVARWSGYLRKMSEPPDLITLLTEQHRDVDLLFYVRAPRPRGRRWPCSAPQ